MKKGFQLILGSTAWQLRNQLETDTNDKNAFLKYGSLFSVDIEDTAVFLCKPENAFLF
jgi:hypothetical protein